MPSLIFDTDRRAGVGDVLISTNIPSDVNVFRNCLIKLDLDNKLQNEHRKSRLGHLVVRGDSRYINRVLAKT